MSNYLTIQHLRARITGEAKFQRVLRNYLKAKAKTLVGSNDGARIEEELSGAARRANLQTRNIRSLNLTKAFLRGRPYKTIENRLKPNTFLPERLVGEIDYLTENGIMKSEFLSWVEAE